MFDKEAFIRDIQRLQEAQDAFMTAVSNAKHMSASEAENFYENVRRANGGTASFEALPSGYSASQYMPSTNHIQSEPVKEIILHETGHALDPQVPKLFGRATNATKLGASATPLGIAAPMASQHQADKEGSDSKLPALAGAASGAALGYGSAVVASNATNKLEDNANDFVKRHFAQELGSAEAGEKAFQESVLPTARKTYTHASKLQRKMGLFNGLVGGGIGLLGASAIHRNHEKKEKHNKEAEETTMNYGLTKLANVYQNDPFWNILNDDLKQKEVAYDEAKGRLDPELIDKENRVMANGVLGGAGVGASLGTLGGVLAGTQGEKTLKGRIIKGGAVGTAGGMLGLLTGAAAGGVLATPFAHHYRKQQDPELMKQYRAANHNWDASQTRLMNYEDNDPIFNQNQTRGY